MQRFFKLVFALLLSDSNHHLAILSRLAVTYVVRHLWYLIPETVALALFDKNVSIAIKTKMAQNILATDTGGEQQDNKDHLKKYILTVDNFSTFPNMGFASFATPAAKGFLKRFGISPDFLEKDPSTWSVDPDFNSGESKLRKIVVVNDVAKRGVKLIQDYNQILTKNEEEKQFLLNVVAQNRKLYPTVTKSSLIANKV